MADSTSLALAGDFGKAADTLIKKVSDAVGGICRPAQIKRVAKAEAEAAIIRAEGEAAASTIQKRAMMRLIEEETRHQENIEAITMRSLPHLKEGAKPEKVCDDWIRYFFNKCRDVSDGEVQELWARILAGEANSPGNMSRRTLALLESMDREDAEYFTKVCAFVWVVKNPVPIIFGYNDPIYSSHGITFEILAHLDSIGLVHFDVNGFVESIENGTIVVDYLGTSFEVCCLDRQAARVGEANKIQIGTVLFTKTGEELFSICERRVVEEFEEFAIRYWISDRMAIAQPLPE